MKEQRIYFNIIIKVSRNKDYLNLHIEREHWEKNDSGQSTSSYILVKGLASHRKPLGLADKKIKSLVNRETMS